jgi:uncharacterized membrane protein
MRVLLTAQFAGERNRLYLALSVIMLMNLPPSPTVDSQVD